MRVRLATHEQVVLVQAGRAEAGAPWTVNALPLYSPPLAPRAWPELVLSVGVGGAWHVPSPRAAPMLVLAVGIEARR